MKYRIKQVGNKFYPQYKSGWLCGWNYFYYSLKYLYDREIVEHTSIDASKNYLDIKIEEDKKTEENNRVTIHSYP